MKDVRNSTRVHTHNIIMEKIMSTRIGITLEDEIYNKYKEILFKEKKTIQNDLTEFIVQKIQKTEKQFDTQNNEQ